MPNWCHNTLTVTGPEAELEVEEVLAWTCTSVRASTSPATAIGDLRTSRSQGGRDECQETYIDREQLRELRTLCLRILALPTEEGEREFSKITPEGKLVPTKEKIPILTAAAVKEAAEILPTASGFFFGDTSYGGWYREDIEDTVKQLDRALSMPDEWDFHYQSSW